MVKEKLTSRKFWMAVLGALLPVLNSEFGWNLPVEAILSVAAVIIGYILVEGNIDAKRVANEGL
ncbi:MAG: hypothetical protein C4551_02320 [Bacillota bacterium]|nr:MAG: hypothetical protein C4551_02320 [Bacillota bacterium]